MVVKLKKDSIDLGIVTNNGEAMIAFYRDVLGFGDLGETAIAGSTMRRLECGTSAVKIVVPDKPAPDGVPGGIPRATGYRYWTMSVSNLSEIVAACEDAGRTVVVPIREIRPGVTIAIVEDPDGNWVEFVDYG
jgi:catechol 2,3-dioxygenase-like lactoylglutathione lyase family enzyme